MSYEGKRPADWTPATLESVSQHYDDITERYFVALQLSRELTEDELSIIERTLVHHLPATLTGITPQEG